MKINCTILPHRGGGLFSQLNKVISVMASRETASVAVDWTEMPFYQQATEENLWRHLFSNKGEFNPDSPRITAWPDMSFTGKNAATKYQSSPKWRVELNRWWSEVTVRRELEAEAEAFLAPHRNKPLFGALVRSLPLAGEQPGKKMPPPEKTMLRLEKLLRDAPHGKIFLAADNQEALAAFQARFGGSLLHRDAPRSPDWNTEPHQLRPQTVRDLQTCLIEALVLSRCDHFVHNVSNMATAVLYMRPLMPHTFISVEDGPATRTSIINRMIARQGYRSYLEIGLGNGEHFDKVRCAEKESVDPGDEIGALQPTHRMTSDEFFARNRRRFDLVFIDGLHHCETVYRDICNALAALSPGGMVVCHDMNPTTEDMQAVPRRQQEWTGDCWKAWVRLRRERPALPVVVADTDYGVGVIFPDGKPGSVDGMPDDEELTWENLVRNRRNWLDLVSVEEAELWSTGQTHA